jgi:hypothetical protein
VVERLGGAPNDEQIGVVGVGYALSVGSALSVRSRWSMLSAGGDRELTALRRALVPLVVVGGVTLAVGLSFTRLLR